MAQKNTSNSWKFGPPEKKGGISGRFLCVSQSAARNHQPDSGASRRLLPLPTSARLIGTIEQMSGLEELKADLKEAREAG